MKVPLFPLHTWLPDAHTEAPTAGSVILAGLMLKLGTYGFLRFAIPLFPAAAVRYAWIPLTLAVVGIIYGAVVATMQPDLKRLIAYSSIAHLGFVVLGTFALTQQGLDGAVFTMLSHGLTTGVLFLLVGLLYERRHTRLIADLGGIWKVAPVMGGRFVATAFASVGLPGFSGFVGEFLALLGTFLTHRWYAVVAASGVILAAVYLLWAVQRAFAGVPEGDNATIRDLNARELACILPLLGLSLFLGAASVIALYLLVNVAYVVTLPIERIAGAPAQAKKNPPGQAGFGAACTAKRRHVSGSLLAQAADGSQLGHQFGQLALGGSQIQIALGVADGLFGQALGLVGLPLVALVQPGNVVVHRRQGTLQRVAHRWPSPTLMSAGVRPPTRACGRPPIAAATMNTISSGRGPSGTQNSMASKWLRT